jgi:mitosis inhibitor protein kinase SWE1
LSNRGQRLTSIRAVSNDEVGSGEFRKVMKVRYKSGREGEVFAVKKSKRFKGI